MFNSKGNQYKLVGLNCFYSDFFYGSLEIDYLFTNTPLDETIDMQIEVYWHFCNFCSYIGNFCRYWKSRRFPKIEFNEILFLTKNEVDFIFKGKLYKKVDSVDIEFTFRTIPWKNGHEGLKKISVIDLIFIYIMPYVHLQSALTKI